MAAHRRTDTSSDQLWDEFHRYVNVTSEQLRDWLLTEASGEQAFVGPGTDLPQPGGAVLAVLGKRRGDLTSSDRQVMAQVVDEIRGLLERRPPAGAADDRWRRALLDLGHDPLRADADTAG
ncbi:DUF3140 domain-containing protein [Micromonospora sp. NBC_01813]|uniref:DUF3140 domain-containing protein n=1 Tax=Micromonospora sp. NBC_01813 TaxID=2975988 RepID=UPI002DDAA596|nr:DUF3140 domain-containing protein [Micromonospora sp. NBC_01813]WSA10598.1 DUF3140 domain-containing protein [Micromonospora sp. NBC_01813]